MEAFSLRAVEHDERLTVAEHLSELRARLLLSVGVLALLFAVGMWQSGSLLHVLNAPLAQLRTGETKPSSGGQLHEALAQSAGAFARLAHSSSLVPADQRAALTAAHSLAAASQSLGQQRARAPVTLGLGEPFSTSITVAFAFALLLGLPFLLLQAWGFLSPAIAPTERRAVRSLLVLAPALFAGGVAFGYFVVLPPAVGFLQGFNRGAFDVLAQARDYYRFELITLLALGAIFQIPVLLLALGRAGIVDAGMLRHHRRLAVVGLFALAALLPGTDPVTMVLEALPLVALYEVSIVVLRFNHRRRRP
jgi:sec-independent protein translocase protein TatC